MAVIRCPACGKPNPDFLDICQYCDTPLHEPAAPAAGAAAPAASQPAAPEGGEPEQELLARLRSASTTPEEEAEAQPISEIPDWLSRLGGLEGGPEATPAQPGAETSESASKVASWLDSLRSEEPKEKAESRDWYWTGTQGEAEPSAAKEAAPAPTGELPDWLRAIGPSETGQAAPATDESAGLPDWLQGVSAASTAAKPEPPQPLPPSPKAPAAAPAEELPEWLQGLPAAAPAEAGPAQPPAAAPSPFAAMPAEELPEWLQGLPAAAPPETAPTPHAEPLPAQPLAQPATTSPFVAEPSAPGEGPFAAEAVPGDELPDWLRTMGSAAPSEEAAPALGEVPDWLQSFDSAIPEQPPVAPLAAAIPPAAAPAPEEELPDWLATLGAGTQAVPSMPPAEARPTAWLGTPGAAPEGPAIISHETPAEEQPEWLRDLGASPAAPEAAASAAAAASEEQPEWLRSLGVATPPSQPEGAPPVEAAAGAEQPEWLRGLGTAATIPAGEAPGAPAAPLGAGETTLPAGTEAAKLPSWLSNLAPARPAPVAGVHLAPVALPSWLEAMRPVEVQRPTITPEVDDYEETVGVLAGLHGVLRPQPAVTQPGKTATQVHKLAISDAQAKQTDLLVRTLAEGTQAHPAAKRSFWMALPLARLAVFAVLFVAFVAPLIFPEAKGFYTPAPSWNQAAQDAYNLVNDLSPAEPVLVAFDYDPAQAGELDPLAQAIITNLQRHSVPVVGISTSPVGAATGEALLSRVFADPAAYGSQYMNLGYLPGGPVGMLELTSGLKPLFAADYRGHDTKFVWDTTFLTRTQQLSSFGAIVLVSATPDTVRAWVEQLQYASPRPAIVAAVSAGAEPLVRPYYDPEPAKAQIRGLVSGILGAAQYERQSGAAGVASGEMWDVLGWGLVAIIVVLVVGTLFYGVTGLLSRQKR